jgi:cob(I)alamin adenosyltransferase
VTALADLEGVQLRLETIQYLNRLSDLLFVLARVANAATGLPDVPWRKEAP